MLEHVVLIEYVFCASSILCAPYKAETYVRLLQRGCCLNKFSKTTTVYFKVENYYLTHNWWKWINLRVFQRSFIQSEFREHECQFELGTPVSHSVIFTPYTHMIEEVPGKRISE